jgi:carbonic anhydrase/acetyltransferase-like protein (isoleucine patch superfamily)
MLLPFNGTAPQIDPTAYVQSSARVIGDVHLGAHASIWFQTVVRADVHHIRIGSRSNIQDSSTIHVTSGVWPTIVGDDVTVGHGVILHGCTIGNRCLVGIGAIVLDGCVIGDECLIGAGALLTPGTKIAAGHLVLGSPAKVVRKLKPAEREHIRQSAQNYVERAMQYRQQAIQ